MQRTPLVKQLRRVLDFHNVAEPIDSMVNSDMGYVKRLKAML